MQIRLTQQGLRTVEGIAPDLFGGFLRDGIPVPTTSGTGSGYAYMICPAGGCRLTVELTTTPPPLELGFVAPDQISARARIVVHGDIPIRACETLTCNSSCGGLFCISLSPTFSVDTRRGSRTYIGLSTNVAIRRDTHAQRQDYFRADLVSPTGSGDAIQETPNEGIETEDINCTSSALCFLVNLFRGTIIDQFRGQFSAALGPIQDALAASSMPDPPGCPTGTTVDGARCRYPDMSLVPSLLGTDGEGNFGALLAGITPGMRANNSYVIAAGDHAHGSEAAPTGMTLDAFAALVSSSHNACVPRLPEPAMPSIPEWMNLRQNNIPGTTTAIDLGVGIAEDWLNVASYHMWNSGLFCLGVNTRLSQTLSAGIFTALPPLASLRNVMFPARNASMALTMRPQRPPVITVGHGTDVNTDPLLRVAFQTMAIDFYVFSEERYIRFLTVTTDMTVPINLTQDMTGLRPVLGTVTTAHTSVTNSSLINAMPTALASAIDGLLGTAIGMFAGSIPHINLPTIPVPGPGGMPLGTINIQIPSGGLQGGAEGTSRYLGLFANLQYHRGSPSTIELNATAAVQRLPFDARVYQFNDDFSLDQLPRVRLNLSTEDSFGHDVEYSYRVDDMSWSEWSTDNLPVVSSTSFMSQGDHHIDVRARVAHLPDTEDRSPARVSFTIDTNAPTMQLARTRNELVIEARDDVADATHLQYNVAFDGRDSTEWTTETHHAIPDGVTHVHVRTRDDSGNTVEFDGPLSGLTIRGGPSTDVAGCGCSTPGSDANRSRGMLAAVLGGLGLVFLARRRNQRRLARVGASRMPARRSPRRSLSAPHFLVLWSLVPLTLGALGCDCAREVGPGEGGMVQCDSGAVYCRAMNRCVDNTGTCSCPAGQMAAGMPALNETTCTFDTSATACMCQPLPALPTGMAGSHLDMAVHTDNAIWLSSYSAGDPGRQTVYGDLVVGRYTPGSDTVPWTHVDGVPTNGTVTGDVNGWRHGVAEPGDDVGRFNSIALTAAGLPRVAYWDTTNDHLKYASFDGTNWRVQTVDATGHNGRYASLVLLAGDIPAIAYRATVVDPMAPGHIIAQVRYAKANNANPAGASDWTVTNVARANTSCRASDCAAGQVCQQSTGQCIATSGTCNPACATGQACIAGTCQAVYTSTWVEDYPPGIGLFCSLGVDSMQRPQLVYYDRDRGNLWGARIATGTAWSTFLIDGETTMARDVGDRGMWSTLVVAADGTWHVAYVDAYNEQVLYAQVRNGAIVGTPEVVDDGNSLGGTSAAFEDGHHIVGDSLSLNIDAMNNVRLVYQDSSAGTLRLARRSTGTTMNTWALSTLDMMNSTGYWARIRRGQVATFWRDMVARHYGVRVTPMP